MTRFPRAAALALAVLVWGVAAPALARPTERARQKAAAEQRRAGVARQLAALKKAIDATEAQKEDAADQLADSEEAISDANRALRDLTGEQAATNARVEALAAQRARLLATIAAQKAQIATLLREHYVAGNEDRIKLLLSGDNPNRINRDLQLMAYVSKAQARLLDALRHNLAAVETNQQQAEDARADLDEIAQEQEQQKATLEQEQAKHRQLLASLSKKLDTQRRQAGNLQRDEARLGKLVDNLAVLIRQQQEAAAAAAKKRREEAQARAAARARAQAERERERLAKLNAASKGAASQGAAGQGAAGQGAANQGVASQGAARPGSAPVPAPFHATDPIDADEPPRAASAPAGGADQEAPPEVALGPAAPDGTFARLKGQMPRPLPGPVVARFGSKRASDQVTWKGNFIRAAEGTDVHAVAPGRVVFAGWMRGWGNLLIIDHGNDYMSIYGYTQSMLKRVGDAVRTGDAIATAGKTGGNEETGLYFEIRHLGRALDPSSWVKF